MLPMSARAFLALQINLSGQGNLEKMRDYEKSLKLPPGRYLMGSEIARWMKMRLPNAIIQNPMESESNYMDSLWVDFDKNRRHLSPQLSLQEIHAWEDWAIENYSPSLPMGTSLGVVTAIVLLAHTFHARICL